jgi:ribose transport system permease protein
LWFVLSQTPYGRYLESIGSNEKAAKLVGINTDRTILLSFAGSGAIAGIAGDLLTAQLGGADATAGSSYLFPAFAAVFLGATVIRPGRYNVWGTVIAVCFVGFAVSGIILFGASTWANDVFDGAALIVAVALSTFSGRARERQASRRAH